VDGLLTVLGAKFTTALRLAEKAVDRVFSRDGRSAPPCRTGSVPLPGGEMGLPGEIVRAVRAVAPALGEAEATELAATHGSRAVDIARRIGDDPSLGERVGPDRPTIAAAVLEAAENEMALCLADVVFRRTGLGTIGHPGDDCLRRCAQILGGKHGWDRERIEQEIHEVDRRLSIPR
jgi:glycerol-3-phosphate dehydrogenase